MAVVKNSRPGRSDAVALFANKALVYDNVRQRSVKNVVNGPNIFKDDSNN